MTHTKPKKFPYFPQINDEVVYIPFGHRLYIDIVKESSLYPQTNHNQYCNTGSDGLFKKFEARVKEIKFVKHSKVRVSKLSLALIENGVESTKTFTVKFHDIDNVIDFIILKQTYVNSLLRNWKIGDYFRTIVEDKWWFGQIMDYNIGEYNMATNFQGLKIVWGNRTQELMSFWDLEPIIGQIPQNKRISIDVTDEDRNQFYVSEVQEWPECGKKEECTRIVNGLTQIIQLNEYKQLMAVFDASKPHYVNTVPYLINLDIIRSRVQNQFYRRHAAIKYDIKFLESNAGLMDPNEETDLVRNARIVVSVCLKFIDKHKATDIQYIYNKVIEDPNSLYKIKYYASVRHRINPNQNVENPLIASSLQNILCNSSIGRQLNLLTPSTTSPRVTTTIMRSNDDNIDVIQLDSDSDEEEEEQTINRSETTENNTNGTNTSSTSVLPPPIPLTRALASTSSSLPQNSKPVGAVRPNPIEERLPQPVSSHRFDHKLIINY